MTVYEVVIEGRQVNDDMLNVFHYDVPDVGAHDWQAGADEIRSHLANYIAPICDPTVNWQGITVREDVLGAVGVFFAFTLGALVGTNANANQLRESSVMVRKLATNGSRPALGWFFQGGVDVGYTNASGAWETAATDEVKLYADDIRILGGVSTSGAQMVIKARNPAAPNTVPYNPVDTMQVVVVPRTVRSRRGGKGS